MANLRLQDEAAFFAEYQNEPLPEESPIWQQDRVIVTPHSAGETRRYEDNVIDILLENLDRLWRGETELRNQIV